MVIRKAHVFIERGFREVDVVVFPVEIDGIESDEQMFFSPPGAHPDPSSGGDSGRVSGWVLAGVVTAVLVVVGIIVVRS